MKLEQGKIVKWENESKQQIVWIVCDDITSGVVIHSDNLLQIGTLTLNLNLMPNLEPFIGEVNIKST